MNMDNQISLGRVDQFTIGEGKEITQVGRIFAVFRISEQEFHVIDGICPHAGGPLAKGKLTGTTVTCPWHGWQFNVCTGQHCLTPQIRATNYPVQVVDGELVVYLPE